MDRKACPSSASQGLAELRVNAVFRRSLNGDSLTLPGVCRRKGVQQSSRSVSARSPAGRCSTLCTEQPLFRLAPKAASRRSKLRACLCGCSLYDSSDLCTLLYRVLFWVGSQEVGRVSSVFIATRYGLDRSEFASRWGARLSAPIQIGREAHLASCSTDTGSSSAPKRPVALTIHPIMRRGSRKNRAIPLLPFCAFMKTLRVNFFQFI